MSMAVTGASGNGHAARARPVNFGQLNSAVVHGDFAATQDALTALNAASSPAARAAMARGSLDALATASAAGDTAAMTEALAALRAAHPSTGEPANPAPVDAAATPAPASAPAPAGTAAPDALSTAEQVVGVLANSGGNVTILA